MEKIEIVNLKPSQWKEYKDLRLKALKEEPQAYLSTYTRSSKEADDKWKNRLGDALKEKSQWILLAKQGDRLVGMVGAFLIEKSTVEVIATYVVNEARGQGISKRLMNHLIAKIKQNKSIKKLIVEVNATQLPAYNLYLKCGFLVVGTHNIQLGDGKKYDVYSMEQLLT